MRDLVVRESKREHRRAIEEALLTQAGQRYGGQKEIAARLHVPQSYVSRVKQYLYDTSLRSHLFYHPERQVFIGRAANGRLFTVDKMLWEQSVSDRVTVDGWEEQDAQNTNLEPSLWEPLIGEPGVCWEQYWREEATTTGREA